MNKAVLFDLDGTLLDTLTTIAYFGNGAMKKFGFREVEKDMYKVYTGLGAKHLIKCLMSESGTFTDKEHEQAYNYYLSTYNEDPTYLTEPYDGIIKMLTSLKENGYMTAVLSNKPDSSTKFVIDKVIPKGLIDICRGGSDAFPLKPDATNALDILDKLSADVSESYFVGDTKTDIETGKNAGLFSIGVLWGFRDRNELETAGADLIVAHPDEILAHLGIL